MVVDLFTARRIEAILDGYIEVKVPPEVRSSVRLKYEWDEGKLTLFEERSYSNGREWIRSAIVQFRMELKKWTVYIKTANHDWEVFRSIRPDPGFEQQLEKVELDREGIFWVEED
ncbi:DUF3024 domain-containing protein [Paenibacillus massiliensis]|uniref:DUF3024 domain-containing protein n=1 Tax=Paenibacillus massiliensis TaxID=225917 RepID=UPI0004B0535C|nr:DUF3024 domain-containing protein [Paenibacillus massiliensis]